MKKRDSFVWKIEELMLRDPGVIEALKKYMEFANKYEIPDGIIKFPPEIEDRLGEIRRKWNLSLLKLSPSGDFSIQTSESERTVNEFKPMRFVKEAAIPYYIVDDNGDIFIKEEGHVYIDVHYAVLDKNDAKKIKNDIWKIVENKINKFRSSDVAEKRRNIAFPKSAPLELASIYHMKDRTFKKYLSWYDLHMKENISCRLIAHIERTLESNPGRAKEALERFRRKNVKWGIRVKGESNVQKGIDVLRRAIFREDDACTVRGEIEEYNCPDHGSECPITCAYYERWCDIFNKLNPM